MKNENKLLDNAYHVVEKNKYTDRSYEELLELFSNTTKEQRNNTKAIIKRDLAIISLFSDIISAISFLVMIILIKYTFIDTLVMLILAMIVLYSLGKTILPGVKDLTYILSVIDDINNTK